MTKPPARVPSLFSSRSCLLSPQPILLSRRVCRFSRRAFRFFRSTCRFVRAPSRFSPRKIRFAGVAGAAVASLFRFASASPRYTGRMRYTMGDLEARSGLTARTIRDYIRCGYLEGPTGRGPGATYGEEQLLRVVAIARMRAKRETWDAIADRMQTWSLAELRAFVRETDPASNGARAHDDPLVEGEAVARRAAPRHAEADTTTELERGADAAPTDLPDGAHLVLAQLLPGLALLVRHDASPLVKRVAAEIVAKYAVR